MSKMQFILNLLSYILSVTLLNLNMKYWFHLKFTYIAEFMNKQCLHANELCYKINERVLVICLHIYCMNLFIGIAHESSLP